MSKQRQIATLENWLLVDKAIFENELPNEKLSKQLFKKYEQIKSSMLLVIHELYVLTNYNSPNKYKNGKFLNESIKYIINNVKNEISNKNILTENQLSNILDKFLIEQLIEKNKKLFNLKEFKIRLETYKQLRNELIKLVQ